MIKILLVDDEADIRGSIKRTLPAYDVDDIGTFGEAMNRLRVRVPYDVAIVDLNLTKEGTDKLGEELLDLLRQEYPLILRVALTGRTPTSVQELLDRFEAADLLLKQYLDLSEVREVVTRVLAKADKEMPLKLRSGRGDLWDQLRDWRDLRARRFEERAERLENDLRSLGPASADGKAAADELVGLPAHRAAFDKACSVLAARLTKVRTEADLATADVALLKLKESYENYP